MPNFCIENNLIKGGFERIAGVDEAGRGSWAGPVVSAAVVLKRKKLSKGFLLELNDSKKLSRKKREHLFNVIVENSYIGIGLSSVREIDQYNILHATLKAMCRAIGNLDKEPDFCLIDGNQVPPTDYQTKAIVRGDSISFSIAAASIIAKVTRDYLMSDLAVKFPGYTWEKNMGYGTRMHLEGLKTHGVSKHHRKSYKPIINILNHNMS